MVNPHYLLTELNILRLKSLGNETAMNFIVVTHTHTHATKSDYVV